MRLSDVQELVAVVAAGLCLAAWRMSWGDLPDYLDPRAFSFFRFEMFADAFPAGAGLAGGLATIIERVWCKDRATIWGFGRWAWVFAAMYVFLTQADMTLGHIAARYVPGSYFSDPAWVSVVDGFRGSNGEFLFPAAAWAFAALGLTSFFARSPNDANRDAREWSGRIFAGLLVSIWLGLRVAIWLGFRRQMMGGGMMM